ncbi:hypothetical protein [Acidovorax lacteus]|uniref:Uncharacterized protein n=1 Tax=Acidovorax lacteus TaxID=1924988 RepID=A0ABP8L2Z6_9BURK
MAALSMSPGVGSYVPARRLQALQSASAAEQRADALQRESERLRAEAAATEQRATALDRAAEQAQTRAQQARQVVSATPATSAVGRPASADPVSALSTVQWAQAARRPDDVAANAGANGRGNGGVDEGVSAAAGNAAAAARPASAEPAPTAPGLGTSPGVPRIPSAVAFGLTLPSLAEASPSPVPGALVSIRA